ncbi:MAG: RNA 3'-terminal phosphate cyclase [bacterium]|nr:RNA 3'-terminal phosphate cyclase [bacterium]
MVAIDGSYLEGGGEILRTAVSLSAVTKKSCHVFNIRKNRPRPGLMPQHLLGIQTLAKLSNAKLEGDELGSEEIKFYPGEEEESRLSSSPFADAREIGAKDLHIKIETAGSITLVLQTLILPALFTQAIAKGEEETLVSSPAPNPVKITFNGGATDTFFSPTIDHFQYVFLKILEKIGVKTEINILKRGYYPEGGANVEVRVYPSKLRKISLIERGNLKKILIISGASEFLQGKKVAERQIAGVREILGKLNLPTEEKVEYYQTQCPGSQVCLIGEFENTVIGVDNLGKLGKRAEDVGKEAALELLKEQKSEACLDKYLADQALPYLALTEGKSSVTVSEITNHCRTNIWVIEKFLEGKFEIKDNLITWLPRT